MRSFSGYYSGYTALPLCFCPVVLRYAKAYHKPAGYPSDIPRLFGINGQFEESRADFFGIVLARRQNGVTVRGNQKFHAHYDLHDRRKAALYRELSFAGVRSCLLYKSPSPRD